MNLKPFRIVAEPEASIGVLANTTSIFEPSIYFAGSIGDSIGGGIGDGISGGGWRKCKHSNAIQS
jgi:hypothetical protein